jgi:phage baseplate assembly protein gpV
VKTIGEKAVQRSVKATGISGHTVEFPFGIVDAKSIMHYVEPIALSNGKVDWQHVYQAHGKLSDVKQADSHSERLVIFEDGAAELEYGRAVTLLSQSASIQTLAQARQGVSILLRDPPVTVGARTAGHRSFSDLLSATSPKLLD